MATDTTLRPGEIKDILLREIEAADLHELDVEEVGTVLEVKDGIARIYGLQKAMAGEMLEITACRWAPYGEAREVISYANAREVLRRANEMIAAMLPQG